MITKESRSNMTPEEIFHELYGNNIPIPAWAYQKSILLDRFTETKLEYQPNYVPLHKIVGSCHDSYANRSWLETLYNLKNLPDYTPDLVKTIDEGVLNEYRKDKRGRTPVQLCYLASEDTYYIQQGQHRLILVKFRESESKHLYIKEITHVRRTIPSASLFG